MVPYIILSVALALPPKYCRLPNRFFQRYARGYVDLDSGFDGDSIYTMNDYSARKTVLVIIISVLAVFLIWLVGILIYSC